MNKTKTRKKHVLLPPHPRRFFEVQDGSCNLSRSNLHMLCWSSKRRKAGHNEEERKSEGVKEDRREGFVEEIGGLTWYSRDLIRVGDCERQGNFTGA